MSTSQSHAARDHVEDGEMIFAFDDADEPSRFASLASFETRASGNPRRITFGEAVIERRPPNPVAALLHDNDEDDEDDEDEDELREFCPAPLRSFSAPPPRHESGLTPPPTDGFLLSCSRGGASDRRKRKCMDDAAVGMPCRIRPLAKRAKSFSFARDASALKLDYHTIAGTTARAPVTVGRSESISIPRPASLRSALGARARSHSSSSGVNAGDSVSSHSQSPSSSSPAWNATASSLEYFCRRSLDVSSPLRLRFRDLMVGSVGRATSYTGP